MLCLTGFEQYSRWVYLTLDYAYPRPQDTLDT